MRPKKLLILLVIAIALVLVYRLELIGKMDLAQVRVHQEYFREARQANPALAGGLFMSLYVLVTGLSLPGATILTLVGGAIFGLLWGTILVSFASSLGATLAFLGSRYLLRDWVESRWGSNLKSFHQGIERDGAFYLFSLRLVPAFPFFLVNAVMGLTPMKTFTFYWVSQVGMLAGTLVYVNAGRELARIESLRGIMSGRLWLAFGLLAILPWVARRIVHTLRLRKLYRGHRKPGRFDRNILVIGAGSAGLVTAYIAAAVRARVTLIEKHRMGGDCLNTGCVPSKALIRSAKAAYQARQSARLGVEVKDVQVHFAEVMERIQGVIAQVEPHDSVERYSGLGVECIQGEARLLSPWAVEISTPTGPQRLTARNIVVATGARPTIPEIPGLSEIKYWTSDTVWEMRHLPSRFLILGAGPIGCELAQSFARLGARVTLVDPGDRVLKREDPEISKRLSDRLTREGIDLRLQHRALSFHQQGERRWLRCEYQASQVEFDFDEVLCAVGRTPNSAGFGLEELGVKFNANKTLALDEFLQTNFPNILACGDVAGPYQFTHTAAHQAWFAAVNSLFGNLRKFRVDYSVIPWATFTDPEIARVGLNEVDARERGVPYEVTTYDFEDLDRAIADGEPQGVVKVLTVPGKDKILGVTIVGEHAGDLLAEYILAMRHGIGLNKILATIHIYPTLAEANKFAAGEWKKAHKPERVLSWLQRYHRWMRGER